MLFILYQIENVLAFLNARGSGCLRIRRNSSAADSLNDLRLSN